MQMPRDADGGTFIAYTVENSGGGDIFVLRREAQGTWSDPVRVNDVQAGDQRAFDVVHVQGANFATAFDSLEGGTRVVRFSYGALGTADSVVVAQGAGEPGIVDLANGTSFAVLYNGDDGYVWARLVGADETLGRNFRVNSTTDGDQQLGGFSVIRGTPGVAERMLVTFTSTDASGVSTVRLRLFENDGDPIGADFLIGRADEVNQSRPVVRPHSDDRILIGWESPDGAGVIRYQIFDPRGDNFAIRGNELPQLGSDNGNQMTGTAQDDRMLGLRGFDLLNGGGGNDSLVGGPQDDTLNGNDGLGDLVDYLSEKGGARVLVNLSSENVTLQVPGQVPGTPQTVDLAAFSGRDTFGNQDVLLNIGEVRGTDLNDIIVGNGQENRLIGEGGDDRLIGRGGADTLDGGSGFDVADYSVGGGGVVVNLSDDTFVSGNVSVEANQARDNSGAFDTLVEIDAARGTTAADTFVVKDGDFSFTGLLGNDTIVFRDDGDGVVGEVTIQDFGKVAGSNDDLLVFDSWVGFTSVQDVIDASHRDLANAADTIIDLPSGGQIRLVDYSTPDGKVQEQDISPFATI